MVDRRQRVLTSPVFRFARWMCAWVALGLVAYAVWGFAADFREAKSRAPGAVATGTVDATSTPVTGMLGTTLVDGVHIRDTPASSGAVLKDLAKGVAVEIVETRKGWFRVREPGGTIGWVTADESFMSVQKK